MKNIISIGNLRGRFSIKNRLLVLFVSLFVSCGWVHDDQSGCINGTWLKVSYTYNILDVDAALNQVDNLSIMIFDSANKYVTTQSVDSLTFQQSEGVIEIEQPIGVYNILVIGGLQDDNYICTTLVAGETSIEEVTIELREESEKAQSTELASLFYGCIENVEVLDYYQLYEVSLVKDSNDFSCLIRCDSEDGSLNSEDFTLRIVSDNSILDYQNNIVADGDFSYYPYQQQSVDIEDSASETTTVSKAIQANINTLRLLENDNTRFEIVYTPTNQKVIDIPLTTYLILSGTYYYSKGMGEQEFLDRQDTFALIFYLEQSYDDSSSTYYTCNVIYVNNWIIRLNEVSLSK